MEPMPTRNSDGSHADSCKCGACYDPYGAAEYLEARVAELEAAIKAFAASYEGMSCYGQAARALKNLVAK